MHMDSIATSSVTQLMMRAQQHLLHCVHVDIGDHNMCACEHVDAATCNTLLLQTVNAHHSPMSVVGRWEQR